MEMSIVVQPTETVPFAHGDDGSLHCVIAPNGHVWGKSLDGESGKKDMELAVYAPTSNGYLWRTKAYMNNQWLDATSYRGLRDFLTKTQQEKIQLIMSQQDTLAKLIGCVHLGPQISLIGNYWREENRDRAPLFLPNYSFSSKVVDCSFTGQRDDESCYSFFKISYDDIACAFLLRADEHALVFRSSEELNRWTKEVAGSRCVKIATARGKTLRFEFCAAQANEKAFNFYLTELHKKEFVPQKLHVLYKGYNIFDFFAIDDALLLAEAYMSDEQMTIAWTIAVAQNQHIRHMRRLCSNNLDLLTCK